MTPVFFAENRVTGKRWQPERRKHQYQFLVMYAEDGKLAVVTETEYEAYVSDLDPHIWKLSYDKFE